MRAEPFVVVAAVAAAAWLQGPAGDANAERRRSDFRYTPDPALVRVLAGAHRSTTADLLWLRTLPDMAKEFADPAHKARWIHHSIDAITDLEPSFMTVYDFGQAYLAIADRSSPGAIDRAVELLEKGVARNPDSAGLLVRLAMIHFIEKKDRAKAVELLTRASTLPGFDQLSASMLSALRAERGEDLTAVAYWAERIENGTPEQKRVAEYELLNTKGEIARRAAREFRRRHGRPPASPDDLREPGLVEPEAADVVLEGLRIDADGVPRYPRAEELRVEFNRLAVERMARFFRDEKGRWPAVGEMKELPKAPPGKAWALDGGRATLVDEPAE